MENLEYETIMQTIDELSPDLTPKEKKKIAEAIENQSQGIPFKDSLEFDEDLIEQIYAYGHQLFSTQKYKDSAKLFQVLYLLDPLDTRFALAIGASYQMDKNYESAIGWYLALAILDQETPLPFYYISDCFLKLDHLMASRGSLEQTIIRCGDFPEFSSLKSRAAMMIDSLDKQIRDQQIGAKQE